MGAQVRKKMTPAQIKLWALREIANNIAQQLTLYPKHKAAIRYCIDAAHSIEKKVGEIEEELKK